MSMFGRFHGFPDVQPWTKIELMSLAPDTGSTSDPVEERDVYEVFGRAPRGFIISAELTLECVPWDNDDYITVVFPIGIHFGSIRKFRTKGASGITSGASTDIAFFA